METKRHYTAETIEDKNIHFKDYKINPKDLIKPKEESIAADICLVENNTLEKYIVETNNYDINIFTPEQYTPIGVVVVPASHTDDGTARVMSLAAMDYNNPDNGNTNGHINICWGGHEYNVPELPNLMQVPYIANRIDTITAETQTLLGFYGTIYECRMCSDYYTEYQNPYDTKSYYGGYSVGDYAIPSPYLEDGSKNPIYHDTSNTGNILADMNGKDNTDKILAVDNSDSTDWKTGVTISNSGYTETIHPAAQCCWRYHTVGTNQGDWYLPSAGELGYLAARWKAINTSIAKIRDFGVFPALVLYPTRNEFWYSSTERSDIFATTLRFNTSYSLANYSLKYGVGYVRSFIAV